MTIQTTAAEFVSRMNSTLADWGVEDQAGAPVYIDEDGNAFADLPGLRVELTAGAAEWLPKIRAAYA
jgi:hypothetical protein